VDSNDRQGISEVKKELEKMFKEEDFRDAALLVLANKQVRVTILNRIYP